MLVNEVSVLEAEAKAAVTRSENARIQLLEIENQRIRGILKGKWKGKGKKGKGGNKS